MAYLCFSDFEIVNACVPNLSWTHFRSLLRVHDEQTRLWYMREASETGWNTITAGKPCAPQPGSIGSCIHRNDNAVSLTRYKEAGLLLCRRQPRVFI
ncbi:MAG: DUF1016 N-terminal domain-containing protein [Eubacteriales bacterium]